MGNVVEILGLLDKDVYNRTEIQQNYLALAEKWGEWEIVGEENSVFTIRYIDVGNALFSGLMKTFVSLAVVFLALAIVFGKIIFPHLARMYVSCNDELVDLATLKSASQIDEMATKKNKKEWF